MYTSEIINAFGLNDFLDYIPVNYHSQIELGELDAKAVYEENGEKKTAACDGVFLAVGLVPENGAFAEYAQLDSRGYFVPEDIVNTKTPGLFVAGDCCQKTLRQVTTACADGAYAAIRACDFINDLK